MAVLGAGSDLIDLNFNYYGNLFQGRNSIINAFRNGPGNFDVEVGYSLELGAYGPDLRLKLTGYQFDVGSKIYGWNGGAEVTTRNGMFSVKAEAGRDKINGTYYTLGGYANVGLQLENVLKGESPFTAPEPIFRSPRNLRRVLTQKVKRNWHQPASVILSRSTYTPPCSASLPGYLITTNSIQTPTASLSGRVPQITTLFATLCWCDVISDASIFIEIYAPNGEFDQLAPFPLPLSAPTGCATVQLLFYSNLPSPGYLVIAPGSSLPVLFAPGGGISIQFNQ
jgi:hypothetical protein